jgi:hypothetical protein
VLAPVCWRRWDLCLGGAAGTGGAALEGAALVFAHAAPDAGVLAGLKGPLEAGVNNRAAAANAFCFLDLEEGWPCISNGEKQFRVLFEARRAVTPIHADQLLQFWEKPFVKLFTRGYKGKGPCGAPSVIFIKIVMLTLCKQGVIQLEIPGFLSDTSHPCCRPPPLSDYLRYGASVSRAPQNPSDPLPEPAPETLERPRGILVIALIVAAEATALLVAAGWYGYELVTGAPVLSFWGAVFTLGLLLAFSAWLYSVGHFLFRGRRWTRAAALVAQLFVLTIGFPTLTAGVVLAGLAMVLPALAAIVLLFDKRVISYASQTGGLPPAL